MLIIGDVRWFTKSLFFVTALDNVGICLLLYSNVCPQTVHFDLNEVVCKSIRSRAFCRNSNVQFNSRQSLQTTSFRSICRGSTCFTCYTCQKKKTIYQICVSNAHPLIFDFLEKETNDEYRILKSDLSFLDSVYIQMSKFVSTHNFIIYISQS